jgi:hypothetical protein
VFSNFFFRERWKGGREGGREGGERLVAFPLVCCVPLDKNPQYHYNTNVKRYPISL